MANLTYRGGGPAVRHREESGQDATVAGGAYQTNLGPATDASDFSSARNSGRRRLWVIVAAFVVLAAAVAGVLIAVHGGSGSRLVEMHGKLLVVGGGTPPIMDNRGPCGTGGGLANPALSDVGRGALLTVYDDTGKIVGTATLGAGKSEASLDGAPMGDCLTPFTVSKLPDRPYFQVELAHRGRVTVARKDLSDVLLTVGG